MSAKQWLQIHLVALCLLGSLFVALSTRSFMAPAGVLAAGVLSVLFTDTWKWLHLNRLVGNLAAIGAVLFSLRDFLRNNSEGQLLAIATLLVYLQVILFFQEKNSRLYWQMILLSLLQVVVGAALHLGFTFGVLLLIYTAVAISTLVLFFLHRETELHAAFLEAALPNAPASPWKKLLGQPVTVRIEGQRQQINDAFLSPALVRQIVYLTLGSLLFSAAFFYTAPRHPAAAWSGSRGFSRPEMGFSRSVELQQMGELLQNDDPVMRVWLTDSEGQKLHRFDPYFAGEVLPIYDVDRQGRARWVSIGLGSSLFRRQGEYVQDRDEGVAPPPAPADATIVKISTVQASDSVFTIMPAYRIENVTDKLIRMDQTTGVLFLDLRTDGNNTTSFKLATTGIKGGRQAPIAPENRPGLRPHRFRFREELALCRKWGEEEERRFAGIKAKADEIVASRGSESPHPILIARSLEDHFQTSGLYTYSLNLNVKRDPQLDPIEDFVVNHHTGHCQYFASALVMMLRSQELPARMVVGYRGSEYNELGDFYQVRQRNAHAWVEVFLEAGQIPLHESVGGVVGEAGGWLRLDPTPGRDDDSQTSRNWMGAARDWLDYVDTIWGEYVVGLSQQRQEQSLYSAFSATDTSAEPALSWESWRDSLRTIAGWFGIHVDKGAGWKVAFDWRAALTAMVLSVLVVLLSRLAKWVLPHIDWSPWQLWRQTGGRRSQVPFYNRLEDLLARRGRTRRPAETPQEYVDHAVRELGLLHGDTLRGLVAAFYRVRFGGVSLAGDEVAAIDHALADLERRPPEAR